MNHDSRWQQVKSFYSAAQDLPPDKREAWLADNCTDAGIRREVRELLAADREATGWLPDSSELGASAPELPPDLEGQSFGRFEIVQRIDSGGMGAVWLARIRDDGREVALKVIQRGLVTDQAMARFLREREILARLDHPGICPMLDSGTTPDGRPFLVMPFLEGAVPITDYCDAHVLDLKGRVSLFRQVCEAVQHAHQNLVVHSDLKPGNVLVSRDGRVQLVDFGISRLLSPGHEELTRRFGEQRPATLDYASPEQLRGDSPSTLSDVYSLGALLYRLLAGKKAYHVETGEDASNEVVPPEPARPAAMPVDLFNICRKAMSLEPRLRYGSAAALGDDLACWLGNRPVAARAPSLVYQAGKFIRRNVWPVVTAATALAGIVALTVVLAVNNARINAQAERIAQERDRAEATAEFWAHLFEQTDPVASESAAPSVEQLLDRAQADLTQTDTRLPAVTRARLLGVLSTSYWNLARQERAREAAQAAVDAVAEAPGEPAAAAAAWKQLANIAMAQGDAEAARTAADAALSAMEMAPGLPAAQRASILDAHALVLEMEGRLEEAAAVMERVIELQQTLPLDEVIVDHATAWGNLAFMYFNLARTSDAPEPWFERAAEGVERSLTLLERHFGPDHPRVGFMRNASGALNLERGRPQAALADFRAAARIAEKTLPPGHEMLAHLYFNQGTLQRQLGDHAGAEAAFARAFEASSGFADEHPHRVRSLIGVLRARLAQGEREAASQALARFVELARRLGEDHPAHLWRRAFERRLAAEPVDGSLVAAANDSGDEELVDYLDSFRGRGDE
ncbi:MAG: serine/threonine-protein kinase [Wenzhouxiangella sp.]|jgi:serine/threonine-protein kinase|nr:serine/threonine-protein kinase [Wenzhouxiangella sp.]